ncbi:GntR family transcriptional regulator [Salimicrobium halophilum]|uniref:DNA-binding transcriptional regulator YhcF, GntR family n=1 Tax=Salimicrobium halophilum TaxID=86666 RepID=A0A1G8SX76_9BACI|nr:GntR family transcriptional regulator [Salimicrobium halophilum]SDJ33848.1 DNA-binding transcriptional regulator YhcF, GntR family [Salimicrobium halophilum]
MIVHIDLESKDPIYTQVRNQIVEGIAGGKLKAGERLPSVRAMASDLGINLHTVNKGYKQLEKEGFLNIHRQRGVVIAPEGITKADAGYWEELRHGTRPIVAEAICRGVSEAELIEMIRDTYRSFGKGGETNGNGDH